MCVAPLSCQVRGMGWQLLRCQARGDCAIDCMTYWDGLPREPAAWKSMRVELAAAVRHNAGCPRWQAAFAATGEQAQRRARPAAPAAVAGLLAAAAEIVAPAAHGTRQLLLLAGVQLYAPPVQLLRPLPVALKHLTLACGAAATAARKSSMAKA